MHSSTHWDILTSVDKYPKLIKYKVGIAPVEVILVDLCTYLSDCFLRGVAHKF